MNNIQRSFIKFQSGYTLIEYLIHCQDDTIDEFERIMLFEDIDGFISKYERKNNAHAFIKKIMAQRKIVDD